MREGSKVGFTLSGPQQSPRFYPPPRKRKGHVYPPPDMREKTQTRDKTQIQKTNILRR